MATTMLHAQQQTPLLDAADQGRGNKSPQLKLAASPTTARRRAQFASRENAAPKSRQQRTRPSSAAPTTWAQSSVVVADDSKPANFTDLSYFMPSSAVVLRPAGSLF
jgi:hypothetical protein